jgi:hypothetical protein
MDHKNIVMLPESYNQLRMELYRYWPELWQRYGWTMMYEWERFVESMSMELAVVMPAGDLEVKDASLLLLNALRDRRGEAKVSQ